MHELAHHGILGMKWGIRRTPAQLEQKKKPRASDSYHEDHRKAHSSKKNKFMSDSELRQRINRLQMEKQYSQLTKREKSAGHKFVSTVFNEVVKEIAKEHVKTGVKWLAASWKKG